ncbi:DeoR family transcriptional regulator [Herbiconiux sp. KACC 21604]|uniref:DeoR family transcriptional regulator n=1 Tax=unclassified Herbiconiux TaxID=2618217 RepID=UPI001490F5C8|nr:DeoR family transcriptional regulator [Herbiconiux sp. SALV-R1]QJU53119.1 DeoR/GlpR transcriptional regulator [Herbiconiux sp. SALV-R1]WPO88060.1 DeoR family transcriptional regulator [Herbiconiux sp. KACC 21604]
MTASVTSAGGAVQRRRRSILAELDDRGRVEVTALARVLGVAEETVRRDLTALEAEGALRRAHGGAVPVELGFDVDGDRPGDPGALRSAPPSGSERGAGRGERGARRGEESAAHHRVDDVAAAVIGMLPASGAVYLDGGAVAEAIASRLTAAHEVAIVTASVPVALAAAESVEPAEVHLLGGRVRPDGSTEGPWARAGAERLRLAVAVFDGGSRLSEHPVLAPDPDAAALAATLAESAHRVVLTAAGMEPAPSPAAANGTAAPSGRGVQAAGWALSVPWGAVDAVVAHPLALEGERGARLIRDLGERGVSLVLAEEVAA